VAPGWQRRGIGRALLASLIEAAEAKDFRQMVAVIGDSANTPSIELHRDAGFRLVGTLENIGFKFGRWLDSVLMQRALGEGASSTPDEA
jgi:phosphinothricin acetyltransferase